MADAGDNRRQRRPNPRFADAAQIDFYSSGEEEADDSDGTDFEVVAGAEVDESDESDTDSDDGPPAPRSPTPSNNNATDEFVEGATLVVRNFGWNPNTSGIQVRLNLGTTYFDCLKFIHYHSLE